MGRKKVIISKIENERKLGATFQKRKNGLMKKAYELSILCNCEVAVIIFSNSNKLYQYASSDIDEILLKYSDHDEPYESINSDEILLKSKIKEVQTSMPNFLANGYTPVDIDMKTEEQSCPKQKKTYSTPRIKVKHNNISDKEFNLLMSHQSSIKKEKNSNECEYIPTKVLSNEIKLQPSSTVSILTSSSDSDSSDDKLKIDCNTDLECNFDDIDDSIINKYAFLNLSIQQTQPKSPTSTEMMKTKKDNTPINLKNIIYDPKLSISHNDKPNSNQVIVIDDGDDNAQSDTTGNYTCLSSPRLKVKSNSHSMTDLGVNTSLKHQGDRFKHERYQAYNILKTKRKQVI